MIITDLQALYDEAHASVLRYQSSRDPWDQMSHNYWKGMRAAYGIAIEKLESLV